MAGYSGTPLIKKLGIKEGFALLFINEPKNYRKLIGAFPLRVQVVKPHSNEIDFIHAFITTAKELDRSLAKWMKQIKPEGIIWISWYKKSSGIPTDINEDVIRFIA